MQYTRMRQLLKDHTVFSINDIKLLEPNFHRRRLNEWQDKGYIKKIIREYYIFSELNVNEKVQYEIANRIYKPSYVSLETALSNHHLIPESIYGITSVSTKKTCAFQTPVGRYYFRTVKPDLFFGYQITPNNHKVYKMADPEKAILDFLYLNTHLKLESDFLSLRLNKEIFFQMLDQEKIWTYCANFGQKTLHIRLERLIATLKSEQKRENA